MGTFLKPGPDGETRDDLPKKPATAQKIGDGDAVKEVPLEELQAEASRMPKRRPK